MGGLEEPTGRKKKKPDYDLSDFIGASKYYYVDPSMKSSEPVSDTQLLKILDRLGVVPEDEQKGYGF